MSGRAQRTRTGSGLGERRIPTDPAEKGQECPPAHLRKEGSRSKSEGDTMLCVGRQVGGRGGDRGEVRSCEASRGGRLGETGAGCRAAADAQKSKASPQFTWPMVQGPV